MASFSIRNYLEEQKKLIDDTLDRLLPPEDTFPPALHRAMRYCLFAGGKRLRPILAIAAAEAVGGDPKSIIAQASALELIHTYTLIHDDLPAMDDDDYRRGVQSTHRVFGDAVAILAGDALQTEAFRILANGGSRHSPDKLLRIIASVAQACGSCGLVGGQVVDIQSEGKQIEPELLEYIHLHKTGRLIQASVMLGAVLGGAAEVQCRSLDEYGKAVGLVFQITDDLLDVVGTSEMLGKSAGSDEKRGKATYPALFGIEETKKLQQDLFGQALDHLKSFGSPAEPLRALARLIIDRDK